MKMKEKLLDGHCVQSGNMNECITHLNASWRHGEVSGVCESKHEYTPVKLSVFLSFCGCRAPDTISNVVL